MLLPSDFHDRMPEIVASTPRGRVSRCSCCGALQVRFGNAVLNLDATDLAPLIDAVRSHRREFRGRAPLGLDDARVVELYIAETSVGFAFSRSEIAELESLLTAVARRGSRSAEPFLPESIVRRLETRPDATA